MPPRPEPQQSDRGFMGTLKSKWGPLPVWGWLLLVTILALGYYLWTRRQGAQSQQTAPMSGQPGVVIVNEGQPPVPPIPLPPVKPPKPPEDHDKDEDDGESKGHGHDDHHRHRRHDRDVDDSMGPPPPKPPPIPLPPIGNPPPGPSPVPQPTNVGALFPKIGPAPARGGHARKRG